MQMQTHANQPKQLGELINGAMRMLGLTSKKTPKNCKFCGKELIQKFSQTAKGPIYLPIYHDCDCEEFIEEQKRIQFEKIEKEKKEKELLRVQKEREAEAKRIAKINKLFADSGMSRRALISKFDNYQPNLYNGKAVEICLEYVKNFDNLSSKNGLFIAGPCGVGKSHLAYAIANALIEQGKSVICMTMIDMLMKIKNSFYSNSQTEAEILDIYKNCSLLVIDDLGKERASEWVLQMIYAIIDGRYTKLMPIIITANYTAPELIQKLKVEDDDITATAIVDRLLETCQYVPLEGMSQRK